MFWLRLWLLEDNKIPPTTRTPGRPILTVGRAVTTSKDLTTSRQWVIPTVAASVSTGAKTQQPPTIPMSFVARSQSTQIQSESNALFTVILMAWLIIQPITHTPTRRSKHSRLRLRTTTLRLSEWPEEPSCSSDQPMSSHQSSLIWRAQLLKWFYRDTIFKVL